MKSPAKPLIDNAVFWPSRHAGPIARTSVRVAGDENGVMLSIEKSNQLWELQLSPTEARRLIWWLHRETMKALAEGVDR